WKGRRATAAVRRASCVAATAWESSMSDPYSSRSPSVCQIEPLRSIMHSYDPRTTVVSGSRLDSEKGDGAVIHSLEVAGERPPPALPPIPAGRHTYTVPNGGALQLDHPDADRAAGERIERLRQEFDTTRPEA